MWFVLILASLLALSVASSPLLIDLPDGKIQGFKLNAYHAYRGIPYAAPPTGNNRWVPPQPVEPWKPAILSTTEFKANCLQPTPPCWYSINKAKESSEDCKCTLSPSLCKVRRITSLTRFDLFVCLWFETLKRDLVVVVCCTLLSSCRFVFRRLRPQRKKQ